MKIQSVKIISNNISYGPEPFPEDEVEQHLTISATGRVWYTSYKYGDGFGKHEISRKQHLAIGKPIANEILELFLQYMNSDQPLLFATDIGTWEMIITDTEDKTFKFNGSLFGEVMVGEIDLTDYIRKQIPIDNLFVFGDSFLELDDE